MQQCMMGAMNEFWLVEPRMNCNMHFKCHHCWDTQADFVCAYIFFFNFRSSSLFTFYWFDHLDFIEKAKNGTLYNDSAAIIHKVNVT